MSSESIWAQSNAVDFEALLGGKPVEGFTTDMPALKINAASSDPSLMDAICANPSLRVADTLLGWIFILVIDVFQAPHLAIEHLAFLRKELVWFGDVLPANVESVDLDAFGVSHWEIVACDLDEIV